MSDAPERIGLVSDGMGRWALWNREDWPFADALPYVRADLFDAQARRIEELEAALRAVEGRVEYASGWRHNSQLWQEPYMDEWDYDGEANLWDWIFAPARAALSKGTEGE